MNPDPVAAALGSGMISHETNGYHGVLRKIQKEIITTNHVQR